MTRTSPSPAQRARVMLGIAALACAGLSACSSDGTSPLSGLPGIPQSAAKAPQALEPSIMSLNVAHRAQDVAVDTVLAVATESGELSRVRVVAQTDERPKLRGAVTEDARRWVARDRLEPGTDYRAVAAVLGPDGAEVTKSWRFRTQDLTLDQQTYPSVVPQPGSTVGVGMPVIVRFDVAVTDRASIERHLTVTSRPSQPGSWHWLSDHEVHFRPKRYWKSGTKVAVDVDINSVPAGGGIYGQESRTTDFTVGEANIYKVDMTTHEMRVTSNGRLLRTIPITTGEQPKFTTRSGVKVIMEKFESQRMNSETVGIPAGSPDAYDIDNVQWAMRLTYSGEFIHAAPWSVGSQGHANVSHGCTGMSTADAAWLYAMTRQGDVVEYVGSEREMEQGNGYAEWNLSWAELRSGSALTN